jgi:hypothetical protein
VAKKAANPWLAWAEVARVIIDAVITILTQRGPRSR